MDWNKMSCIHLQSNKVLSKIQICHLLYILRVLGELQAMSRWYEITGKPLSSVIQSKTWAFDDYAGSTQQSSRVSLKLVFERMWSNPNQQHEYPCKTALWNIFWFTIRSFAGSGAENLSPDFRATTSQLCGLRQCT